MASGQIVYPLGMFESIGCPYRTSLNNNVLRFLRTSIITEEFQRAADKIGVNFAAAEDAALAMLRIASDKSINGETPLNVQKLPWQFHMSFLFPAVQKLTVEPLKRTFDCDSAA
jgi:hypothetical protein